MTVLFLATSTTTDALISELVEGYDYETLENIIHGIDDGVQDYDFTANIFRKLGEKLKAADEALGIKHDPIAILENKDLG